MCQCAPSVCRECSKGRRGSVISFFLVGTPIAKTAAAYMNPETGETFILFINQGLYVGDILEAMLQYPNQLHHLWIIVDDCCPKHLRCTI